VHASRRSRRPAQKKTVSGCPYFDGRTSGNPFQGRRGRARPAGRRLAGGRRRSRLSSGPRSTRARKEPPTATPRGQKRESLAPGDDPGCWPPREVGESVQKKADRASRVGPSRRPMTSHWGQHSSGSHPPLGGDQLHLSRCGEGVESGGQHFLSREARAGRAPGPRRRGRTGGFSSIPARSRSDQESQASMSGSRILVEGRKVSAPDWAAVAGGGCGPGSSGRVAGRPSLRPDRRAGKS